MTRKEVSARYRAKMSDRTRIGFSLRQFYGMTIEAWDAMREAQGYACAVCGLPEAELVYNGNRGRLTVDHNHVTGDIRGLLCSRCNAALGNLREEPAIMHALIRYIEQYPGPYGAESSVRMTRAKHKARARSEHPSLLEVDIHE
jgi:hypothetical protein